MSPRARVRTDLGLIGLTVLAAALSILSVPGLSAIAVFACALVLPGAAIGTRIPLVEPLSAAALIVGLSLAVDVVVGLVLIWTQWWHPAPALIAVAAGACLCLGADAAHRHESRPVLS